MDLPLYLAMTPGEFQSADHFPQHIGWMSCHFSSATSGLSNFPQQLPPGSLFILDDAVPMAGHDIERIFGEMEEFITSNQLDGLLLDFQREQTTETRRLAERLCALPCPVAITEDHGKELSCALFLSPCPAYVPLDEYIDKWKGRALWLEIARTSHTLTLTESGCKIEDGVSELDLPHRDETLYCHYQIQTSKQQAVFSLQRTKEDIQALLAKGAALGIQKAVGLYQELET